MKTLFRTLLVLSLTTTVFAQAPAAQSKKAAAKPAAKTMAAAAPAGPAGPVVLRGGKLLTISHGVIENGVVVIENGKITAVGGANTATPRGARVIDCAGMTVYPGLIDSNTQLGLTEISAVDMT